MSPNLMCPLFFWEVTLLGPNKAPHFDNPMLNVSNFLLYMSNVSKAYLYLYSKSWRSEMASVHFEL